MKGKRFRTVFTTGNADMVSEVEDLLVKHGIEFEEAQGNMRNVLNPACIGTGSTGLSSLFISVHMAPTHVVKVHAFDLDRARRLLPEHLIRSA